MAELKALYKKLRRKGYWPVQIYQLIFLYMDCKEKEREKLFYDFLEEIDPSYDDKSLEQIIKCIAHNIPYEFFIGNGYIGPENMNEMRRFLEDTIGKKESFLPETEEEKRYYEIIKRMPKDYWYKDIIYQFRRFVKGKKKMHIDDLEKLYDYIVSNKIRHWVIISIMYNIYIDCSLEDFYKFINSEKFLNLIKEFRKNEDSDEGDFILLDMGEYMNNFKETYKNV